MTSPKNLAFVILLLAVVGGGIVVWRQHRELVELREAAMDKQERAGLQKRLWDAEKRATALENQLAARTTSTSPDSALPTPEGAVRRMRTVAGGPGGPLNNLMSTMDKPEVQRLLALQQKAALDGRYAALFKSLNLSPEQLEKFKSLLVEKQTALQDVVAAGRARGLNPLADPEGLRKMVADTQAEVDHSIKAEIGEAGFAQYQEYQQTLPQRNLVSQLQQSLSYTRAPLSEAQAEQLIGILAHTSPSGAREAAAPPAATGMNVSVAFSSDLPGSNTTFSVGENAVAFAPTILGMGGPRISDEAIAAAQSVLSPPQLAGLQQLQQQQLAQQQLQQNFRQSFGPARPVDGNQMIGGATSVPGLPGKTE